VAVSTGRCGAAPTSRTPFVVFDDVEIPRDRLFLDGDVEIHNGIGRPGIRDNMTNHTTLRAFSKLEFADGLATRMAEAINDQSPATLEMLGELSSYVEVTGSAVLLSAEHGYHVGDGVWSDGRPLHPMRLLATWFPRVSEIITLLGRHNRLAAPTRAQLDDAPLRPLLDEFLPGAGDVDTERRAARRRWQARPEAGRLTALSRRATLLPPANERVAASGRAEAGGRTPEVLRSEGCCRSITWTYDAARRGGGDRRC
jgi:hypothetical protein